MNIIALLLVLVLAGCASDVPRPISTAPSENISLKQALQNLDKYRAAAVRWGGTITTIENRRDTTWIEIVEQPLDTDGQPRATDKSAGRFLARVDGFLDPTIFTPKRLVTIAGSLADSDTRPIGEHPYTYPVVHIEHIYLWPIPSKAAHPYYYRSPYWYDPWYPWGRPYPRRHVH